MELTVDETNKRLVLEDKAKGLKVHISFRMGKLEEEDEVEEYLRFSIKMKIGNQFDYYELIKKLRSCLENKLLD